MHIIFDTNMYAELARGDQAALDKLQRTGRVYLTFITIGELRAGFLFGTKSTQNEKNLQKFLSSERVTVLYADAGTSHYYARIYADLRRRGTPVPTNDLWIGALAMQHGLPLYTKDAHFQKIESIDLIQ